MICLLSRLLGYKTCLDTKPVLYQDRFCSLTHVHEFFNDLDSTIHVTVRVDALCVNFWRGTDKSKCRFNPDIDSVLTKIANCII